MLKHNSVNVHLRSSHCKFGACQKWEQASYIGDFGNILTISLKAHYYPAYQVEQIVLTEQSRHYGILFMKTFCNVVNSIICSAKNVRASIVLKTECVQFVL